MRAWWVGMMFSLFASAASAAEMTSIEPPYAKLPPRLAEWLLQDVIMEGDPQAMEMAQKFKDDLTADPSLPFWAKEVDLNDDGRQEWMIRQADNQYIYCAAHNCRVWVFGQTSSDFAQYLRDAGDYSNPIAMLPTKTNGWHDIRIEQHNSAVTQDVVIYKFNGRAYAPAECFEQTFSENQQDPALTAVACSY